MAGAGTFGAGLGPAGIGPSSDEAIADPPAKVLSALYDPNEGQCILDESGGYVSIHPTDQRVLLALGIEKKKIPSAPTLGQSFRTRAPVIDSRTPAILEDEVRVVLAPQIRRREIELLSVTVENDPTNGGSITVVKYKNLLTNSTITIRRGT